MATLAFKQSHLIAGQASFFVQELNWMEEFTAAPSALDWMLVPFNHLHLS